MINELSKILIFSFGFSYFSKFQIAILKNLIELPSFFKMEFEGSMKFYYVTNIFDLHTFDNETTALWKFVEISTEVHFVT